MRRWAIGAAAGVLITLVAASGVSAYWQAQQTMNLSTIASGDLSVAASWKSSPSWTAMYPGDSREAIISVTPTIVGQTLRWRLRVTSTINPALVDHLSFQAWEGACGGTTPIPSEGNGPYGSRSSFEVCVRYTLDASTPRSLAGQNVSPVITVVAEQASS